MNLYSTCCFLQLLLICSLYLCVTDGLSLRSRRHKKTISNRIRDNDISFYPIFRKFNSLTKYLQHGSNAISEKNDPLPRLEAGSSALSGVPGCSDCFLGLQVSRREAYVVSYELFKNAICKILSFLISV